MFGVVAVVPAFATARAVTARNRLAVTTLETFQSLGTLRMVVAFSEAFFQVFGLVFVPILTNDSMTGCQLISSAALSATFLPLISMESTPHNFLHYFLALPLTFLPQYSPDTKRRASHLFAAASICSASPRPETAEKFSAVADLCCLEHTFFVLFLFLSFVGCLTTTSYR